jgi:hypothetical protein
MRLETTGKVVLIHYSKNLINLAWVITNRGLKLFF